MFTPSVSLAELMLRGTLMYLLIFVLMRIFRREAGTLSIPDLLVVVLVADAAQNGLSSDYRSITEGAVLVGTIFFWNYALDWLAYRWTPIKRLLQPPPLALIRDGMILRRNLKSELISVDDLLSQLREHGIDDPRVVKRCFIEPDGHLSVVKFADDEMPERKERRTVS
ncbi:MAG TPA: YetF domain-containing protein [Gemmatimonadales bacterium]|nr:YetF domain-containing protein [Gemmatimonadales bacterium]